MAKVDLLKMEMPEALRGIADMTVAHAKNTFGKAKVASDEAVDAFKNIYGAVTKATADYNLKLIEIARTNTRAALEYGSELLDARSSSEFIALSTAQLHKHFEVVSAQNKELCALAQKAATEVVSPVKASVEKAFKIPVS